MFRPLLGPLQALRENRSKIYVYFNALWIVGSQMLKDYIAGM